MIHTVKPGESLALIASNYRIPFGRILAANPKITNPNILFVGQKVEIPGLPEPSSIPYHIQVSLGQRKLTLFHNGQIYKIYPIAIGKILTQTPLGEYVIVNREPQPGGPFGVMWLSLSRRGYGIHGTNNPSSIGKAVSHGCIRMYNKDVLEVARLAPNGTRVVIQS
ncbi:L,D-transpeptidase family protein [Neobacillus sp. D3-1R]|uniref:L,D-transpeptidase family protein n=1 Tax=Neobacillus sp. D3-1R TaxID=3445778 RepID=UPI003FA0A189